MEVEVEMEILNWPVSPDLALSPEYESNNRLALEASKLGRSEIIKRYTYVSPEQILEVLRLNPLVWDSFGGVGIDLGGGVGCVSSAVACSRRVERVYCLELVENAVRMCQPLILDGLRREHREKIVSVIGDFDCLELEDDSLDFAVMWDSFHHSANPVATLLEVRRVLKPGGRLVLIDRAHNNSVSDGQIASWLSHEYDEDFKRKNFMNPFEKLTREMNGEHEWRFGELESFLQESNFTILGGVGVKFGAVPENDAGYEEVSHPVDLGGFIKKKFMFVCE